jgi:hypothetical protein
MLCPPPELHPSVPLAPAPLRTRTLTGEEPTQPLPGPKIMAAKAAKAAPGFRRPVLLVT